MKLFKAWQHMFAVAERVLRYGGLQPTLLNTFSPRVNTTIKDSSIFVIASEEGKCMLK